MNRAVNQILPTVRGQTKIKTSLKRVKQLKNKCHLNYYLQPLEPRISTPKLEIPLIHRAQICMSLTCLVCGVVSGGCKDQARFVPPFEFFVCLDFYVLVNSILCFCFCYFAPALHEVRDNAGEKETICEQKYEIVHFFFKRAIAMKTKIDAT